MSFSPGGGGGGGSIASSSDVVLNNPASADALKFDAAVQKWKNQTLPAVALSGSYNDLSELPGPPDVSDVNGLQTVLDSKIPAGAHWMQVVVLPTEGSALPGDLNPDYPALIFVQAS